MQRMYRVLKGKTAFPKKICKTLDDDIIMQNKAEKIISFAIYNHYKSISHTSNNKKTDVENLQVKNIVKKADRNGKKLLLYNSDRIINVPFTMADITSLTEVGYIFEDVENIILKLLKAS